MPFCSIEVWSLVGSLRTLDLKSQQVFDAVHEHYAEFQAAGPAVWNASLDGWIVTQHALIKQALKDPRLSVEKIAHYQAGRRNVNADVESLSRVLRDWMVFADPPRHGELRRAMQGAFLARDVPRLEAQVRRAVEAQLDGLPEQPELTLDIVEQFAYPLPATVISDLFGLRPAERAQMKDWSTALGRFVLSSANYPGKHRQAAQAVEQMGERFRVLIADHRAGVGNGVFTSRLLEDGAHLSDAELVHGLVFVLFAGHETTANLIASAVLSLARRPRLLASLRSAPALVAPFIEEVLRLEGPVQLVYRLAREALEIGDVRIEAGERVVLVLNAGNRDPRAYAAELDFDLDAERARHLAFGPGTHMCLGAPLARLIGRLAIEALLWRYEAIQLLEAELAWRDEVIIHGLQRLPVELRRSQSQSTRRSAK